ncbi:T-cell surface glycoprotein CD3 epsilon chain-like isoform X2 [Polyodon spathula]|uniref:T-cell surface glycoprotein CD3 epsilon chain-like isoform X2 n=1 Tax=Polyodon spathula TaxID=7913 RepID=UPI001B7DD429|nr:T-cell surface glycoprotein CD3 epsilon chain-like isoform X2 [Polyodon spathula]
MKLRMKKATSLLLALFIAVCSGQEDGTEQGQDEGTEQGSVYVSGTEVTLTCPFTYTEEGDITWKDKKGGIEEENRLTFKTYDKTKDGLYHCIFKGKQYSFYVKAKVCEGCVEVEVVQVIGIIFADLLVTVGVAILVYYWAQNRKGATAMAPARPGRQNRAPPVPSPDYEPIRTGNREVYSGLNKRT